MNQPAQRKVNRVKKGIFVVAGSIFLGLGAVGIVVPIMPTTPFLLLAAACYYKGSERMHQWLLNNKLFGSYIKNYKEGKGISAKGKIFTLSSLWITIYCSAFLFTDSEVIRIILFAVAIGVTAHIIRLPTFKKPNV